MDVYDTEDININLIKPKCLLQFCIMLTYLHLFLKKRQMNRNSGLRSLLLGKTSHSSLCVQQGETLSQIHCWGGCMEESPREKMNSEPFKWSVARSNGNSQEEDEQAGETCHSAIAPGTALEDSGLCLHRCTSLLCGNMLISMTNAWHHVDLLCMI